MNFIENKLQELNSSELTEITGGGFWYDLGVSAHNAFNAAADYLRYNDFGSMHSAG
ncbi:hypothetical protein [Flavobacterium sp. PL12]|uniref:hypothetical protein n=1 Tax=Flavobacterium sp. PL12 TaxID=3071718 RepID=UPI00319E56F2